MTKPDEQDSNKPKTRFSLEKQIPSCHITKGLLNDIEEFLIKELSQVNEEANKSFREHYKIRFTDRMGEEILNSIVDYKDPQFTNSIFEIKQYYDIYKPVKFSIEIIFNKKDKIFSKVNIIYYGFGSRDYVINIYDKLLRILETHRTYNWAFHPHPIILGALWTLLCFGLGFGFSDLISGYTTRGSIAALFSVVLLLYFGISNKIKTFISFDTKAFNIAQNWYEWIIKGILGFLLFGTLLFLLRKKLFGF
jgi:hypothetical protein